MRAARIGLVALVCAIPSAAEAQEVRYYTEGRHLVREIAGAVTGVALRIRIDSDLGLVRIKTAPSPEVRYRIRVRARGGDSAEERRRLDSLMVSASRSGDLLLFRGETAREHVARGLSAEFDITIPKSTPLLEVVTGLGNVEVSDLTGRAILLTRGGTISVEALGGSLEAETQAGNIVVGRVGSGVRLTTAGGGVHVVAAGGDLAAKTAGGDVWIGRVNGEVRAETGGGNVWIEAASGDVFAATSGGTIEVGEVGGKVSAATAGGGIRVASAQNGVRCETAAGPIVLRAVVGPIRAFTSAGNIRADILGRRGVFAGSDLQTWQGDIIVSIPDTLPVTIRAMIDNALGAAIRSEFPLRISREIEGAGRQMEIGEGEIGGGGPVLKIHTLGGNIEILKARTTEPGRRSPQGER